MRQLTSLPGTALAVALVFLWCSDARGWEVDVHAHGKWTYEWYNQAGHQGFFGPYNVDNGAGSRVANLNFWNGGQFDTNLSTGAASGWSTSEVEIEPTFVANEAIRIGAKYRIASYGEPVNEDYLTWNSPGTNTAISDGQWTLFWITVQTPWGKFAIGKRPWSFGVGLQYDGAHPGNSSTESIVLTAPFGPLDIGVGFYPFRYAGRSSNEAIFLALGDPYDLRISQYFSRADKAGGLSKDFLLYTVYSSGNVMAGVLGVFGSFHLGPEAALADPFVPFQRIAQDSDYVHGSLFFKYCNGRFFMNSEAAWLYWTDRYSDPTGILNAPNPLYVEQWRYVLELGAVAGPAKLSLITAWTPGPDRRNGVLIGKQPAAFVWHPSYDRLLGNQELFQPYSRIFSYDYGSGLNAYNYSGWGYIRDAWLFGAHLDYAIAANMTSFVSFFWAQRTSQGYGWGCLSPNNPVPAPGPPAVRPDGNINFNFNGAPGSPNIPDRALGYEVDVGVGWQLLENWLVSTVIGWWQPGAWFSYACTDRSVPGWNIPGPGNNFGTSPGKKIDAVFGGAVNMIVDF